MNRRRFCLELLGVSLFAKTLTSVSQAAPPLAPLGTPKLRWFHNLKTAHKQAIQQDKPLLIVFGASWCTYCHKLERETLGDKRMIAAVERDFIPVHLDFDRDSKVAQILEVEKLPCTVVLSPQADLLLKYEGYAAYREYRQTLQVALEKQADILQVRNSRVVRQ